MDWSDTSHSAFNLFPENLSNTDTTLISPLYFSSFATKKDYLKENSCNQRAAVAVILAIVIASIDLPLSFAIFVIFVAILLIGLVVVVALLMATWAQKNTAKRVQNKTHQKTHQTKQGQTFTISPPELLAIHVLTITPKAAIASSSYRFQPFPTPQLRYKRTGTCDEP